VCPLPALVCVRAATVARPTSSSCTTASRCPATAVAAAAGAGATRAASAAVAAGLLTVVVRGGGSRGAGGRCAAGVDRELTVAVTVSVIAHVRVLIYGRCFGAVC